ncbi:TPA: hypothetical protein LEU69_001564 [Staphylococcus pseudintermedius]|nr:hypothetical protein [Staphylococcus pseudintermedius]HBK0421624.1 hypothetical protein [Staphylococcus pseudintermedius]
MVKRNLSIKEFCVELPINKVQVHYDENFKYISFPKNELPRQGWKIHISFTLETCQEILKIVSDFCICNEIDFKYVFNKIILRSFISSDGHPTSIGKFITIYPKNKKEFRFIVESLCEELMDFRGPYIYSDKRFKESIIYYRYGVINSKSDYLITPDNNMISDNREYFEVPYFESDPFGDLGHNENEIINIISKTIFPYKILRESASGNVYLANYRSKTHILKEGRNLILGAHGTAIKDIQNEETILKILESIDEAPKLVKSFFEWENYYILQTYIEGKTFYELRSDFDFWKTENNNLEKIIKSSIETVKKIHHKGIVINDFNDTNFIVKKNFKVCICDFGSSYLINEIKFSDNVYGSTESYYDYRVNDMAPFLSDFHKLGYLLMELIFPSNRLNKFNQNPSLILKQFDKYCIDNNMMRKVFRIIEMLINQPKGFLYVIDDILDNFVDKEVLLYEKVISKQINMKSIIQDSRYINLFKTYERNKNKIENVRLTHDKKFREIILFLDGKNGNLELLKNNEIKENFNDLDVFQNFNFDFLVNEKLKKKFIDTIEDNYSRISNWIRSTDDYTVNSGIIGFILTLLSCEDKSNKDAVEKYVKIAEERLNPYELNYKDGEYIGIESGYLGIALFYSILYKRHNKTSHLMNVLKMLDDIKSFFEENDYDNEIAMPLKVSGNIASPYLNDGISGYLYVACTLLNNQNIPTHFREKILNDFILPYYDTLTSNSWAKNPGLNNGLTGIAYVSFLIYIETKKKDFLSQSIRILYNVLSFVISENKEYYLPDFDNDEASLSICNGTAGFIFVIHEINSYLEVQSHEYFEK